MTKTNSSKKAYLALSDGTIFEGASFGACGKTSGEVVFNTSMMGYQEILTDPSYKGQLVTMTYPLIGNYGVNTEDMESIRPQVEGFIVKECSKISSNWRSQKSLEQYLAEHNIVGIQDIDTRALTKCLRTKGAMEGVISTECDDKDSLTAMAKDMEGITGKDMVQHVTCREKYCSSDTASKEKKYNIIACDFGIKKSIIDNLTKRGCSVTVVPASYSAEGVLSCNPDGVLLSNGPGDPEGVRYAVKNVKKLIEKTPVFGICLGHQILSLALGAKTFKLKFGHHGGNHPVKNLDTGKVEITAQNHGFAVDPDSLPKDIKVTHLNLNDSTLEGIQHTSLPVFSVQYHPESSPGPHDSGYLFDKFINIVQAARK